MCRPAPQVSLPDWILRLQTADHACAFVFSRVGARPWLSRPLIVVSRLGDGWAWGGLVFLLPLFDVRPPRRFLVGMALLAVLHVLLVALLKRHFMRRRPFECCVGVYAHDRPLDRYSFPSGHVLHAVAFSTLASLVLGGPWTVLLWLFTGLLCASRMLLGLHFLSDVLAGALIGAAGGWGASLVLAAFSQ